MKTFRAMAVLMGVSMSNIAAACPFCDSETAEATRAGLFNEEFVPNLFAQLLPFIVVVAIALAIHFDWSRLPTASNRDDSTP